MNSNGVKPLKHNIAVPQSHNVSVSQQLLNAIPKTQQQFFSVGDDGQGAINAYARMNPIAVPAPQKAGLELRRKSQQ